jgi:hypothetical protein
MEQGKNKITVDALNRGRGPGWKLLIRWSVKLLHNVGIIIRCVEDGESQILVCRANDDRRIGLQRTKEKTLGDGKVVATGVRGEAGMGGKKLTCRGQPGLQVGGSLWLPVRIGGMKLGIEISVIVTELGSETTAASEYVELGEQLLCCQCSGCGSEFRP